MAGVLLVARSALVAADLPAALRLVILVAAGCIVYVAACLWRAPAVTSEIRAAIGRRRPASGAVAGAIEPPLPRPQPID
jgi:hypothetical protein